MSGTELDTDGSDSYHEQHPWEQLGHPLYIPVAKRAKSNWPPESAWPTGEAEAKRWDSLPDMPPETRPEWYREYRPSSINTASIDSVGSPKNPESSD